MRNKARLTQHIRDWAESINVEIVRVKQHDRSMIGIHLLEPTQSEIEDALQIAERDLFPAIYIHTFSSWAPGSMKQFPVKAVRS